MDCDTDVDLSSNDVEKEESTNLLPAEKKHKASRKISPAETATLNTFYHTGMKGEGKRYALFIENASREIGLSCEQVKVSKCVLLGIP